MTVAPDGYKNIIGDRPNLAIIEHKTNKFDNSK